MIFEVFQSGSNKLWYFHLKGKDDEILAVSEGYQTFQEVDNIYNKYFLDWTWRERDGNPNKDIEGTERGKEGST